MNIFHMHSSGLIDFTILQRKIKEFETEQIDLPSKNLKKRIMQSRSITEQEIEKGCKTILARNRVLDPSRSVKTTKSLAYTNIYDPLYRSLAIRSNSVLVELDLNHCFPQLLESFSSGMERGTLDIELPYYNSIKDDLADFFSCDIRDQEQVSRVLGYMVSLNNPYINLYLSKIMSIVESNMPVIIVDAFKVEKTIKDAPPLQSLIMPFSSSINTLAYAVAHVIEKRYTYYNKFAYIHKGKMYYYVRNTKLALFLDSKFYLDGMKLNIKMEVANNVVLW